VYLDKKKGFSPGLIFWDKHAAPSTSKPRKQFPLASIIENGLFRSSQHMQYAARQVQVRVKVPRYFLLLLSFTVQTSGNGW
jgi:hypothetical protein